MVTVEELQRLVLDGADVVGRDGHTIGHVGQLFLDAASGRPAWVTVTTGAFGRGESFVPLTGAVVRDHDILVRYHKDDVKHAPRIDSADGSLSPADEAELYRYYGTLPDDDVVAEGLVGRPVVADDAVVGQVADDPAVEQVEVRREYAGDRAHDDTVVLAEPSREGDAEPRPSTDADGAAVAYAEQTRVIGTERVPTERVRLRRYTVTEEREITVPVEREEYRVEYEPAEGAAPPADPETVEIRGDHRAGDGR